MADIKIKHKEVGTIKKLDKAKIYTQKVKDNIVNLKDRASYSNDEENSQAEYGGNKISQTASTISRRSVEKFDQYGKKAFKETTENIQNASQKIKKKIENRTIKKKLNTKDIKKNIKTIKGTTEKSKKIIKNTPKTIKQTVKVATKTTKEAAKGAKKAFQIAKVTAKQTVRTIKLGIKASIAAIKAILLATKALIAFLIAGGWIVVVIIIVICLIAMLCSSIFGIFFASENTGSTITINGTQQVVTMNQVISELNIEFMNKITQIQKENPYDEYDINSKKAEWKDILAVYTVKISEGNDGADVITLNDNKVNLLKEIFWEMNEVTFTKEEETHEEIKIGLTSTEHITVTKVKLHIVVNGKTAIEMADKYNFNAKQREQLAELINEKYASMWTSVIYGSSVGSNDIVNVALQQVGNVGGQPFWSWYGFQNRVEWCACFVSWCANECGYIEAGIIPKFAGCESEGVSWFKTCGLWKDGEHIPKARRYYLF